MRFLLATIFLLAYTGFYTLEFNDIDNNNISMSQYEGKKLLLVNIATGSSKASQLAGLQQLHEQYGDSVIIIGFPSNSFGNESRSNAGIKEFCSSSYGVTFLLASKNPVTGPDKQSVFQWLTTLAENGVWGNQVGGDYQKFLINAAGELTGVFSPAVDPLSTEVVNALTANNN